MFENTTASARGIGDMRKYAYVLYTLVKRDLKGQYSKSYIGVAWMIIHPLMLLALYMFVFSGILDIEFRRGVGDVESNFAFFVFSGLLPYIALSSSTLAACSCLKANRSLLDKSLFPAEIIPLIPVFRHAIPELLGLILLCIGCFIFTDSSLFWVWLIPVIMIARILLSMGLAWIIAILNVFIKDVAQFLPFVFTFLLFLTPIFYSADKYPAEIKWALYINPLYYLSEAYRKVIIDDVFPIFELSACLAIGGGGWLFWMVFL
jgi:lipopolysaccharide transport system permease protein